MIGEGYRNVPGLTLYPTVDPIEYLPAFIMITFIPFTFGITDRVAFGFIANILLSLIPGLFTALSSSATSRSERPQHSRTDAQLFGITTRMTIAASKSQRG